MVAFSTAFLAACLVLAAAGGIRMIRDDGTKHLTGTGSTVGTAIDIEERRQEGVFVKLIDTLGMRGQQALRRLYGPVRLRALDQRLRSAATRKACTSTCSFSARRDSLSSVRFCCSYSHCWADGRSESWSPSSSQDGCTFGSPRPSATGRRSSTATCRISSTSSRSPSARGCLSGTRWSASASTSRDRYRRR